MTSINDNQPFDFASLGLQAPSSEKSNEELGQQDFLKLLTAQLNNQDPMSPQENGDFLAQMAQFSTVDGIQQMQKSMQDLASTFQSSQALQASALVGREVLVPSQNGVLDANGMQGAVDIPGAVGNLAIKIHNEAGEVVKTIEQGSRSTGSSAFAWDGLTDNGEQAPLGRYKVVAESTVDGEAIQLNTYMSSNVTSVSMGAGINDLLLNLDGIGSVKLSEVKAINA